MKPWILSVGLLLAVGALGCGQTPPSQKPPVRIGVQALPPLGEYVRIPGKDCLELAAPARWIVLSRKEGYIFRMKGSDSEIYPRIIVTAEDCDGIANLTEENAGELAAQLGSPTETVVIGNVVAVAHEEQKIVKVPVPRSVEILSLETVVDGRKYRFELKSEEGSLEQDRPYLHAVVNGARFHERTNREANDGGTAASDEEG